MYLPEKYLLVLLTHKELYNSYKDLIELEYIKENYRELHYIYLSLIELHDKTTDNLSIDDVQGYFYAKYPEAKKDVYDGLFASLKEIKTTPDSGNATLAAVKQRKNALSLSTKAFELAQGRAEVADLQPLLNSLTDAKVDHSLPLVEVSDNLEELIDSAYKDQGARWRLNCLNKSLGSLRAGDFGFIFARPETGKTTFLASEVTHMVASGKRVVWLNNEEQGTKVMLRIYQAFFGVTLIQLLNNTRKYKDAFYQATNGKFKLFDSATLHRKDIQRVVEQLEPEVVVYDQIDKITGFSNDREDLRLGSIYQWGRELAKGRHAAIGVCQADGTAEGVRYLTMDHVANAKTSKQAEADWILGIGKSHDTAEDNIRFFNISKNKLLGDADSNANLRHGRFSCIIRPEIARYEDMVNYD